jgi:acetylornithine deacetylase/succinyl-diaminopimelate desuccinylase-like protein
MLSKGPITTLFAASLVLADNALPSQPEISPAVREQFAAVATHPQVKQALNFIKDDDAKTLAEQKTIVGIASPPFKEQTRAQDYVKRLAALGFKDASIDKEGNVIAVRPGSGSGPKLVVSAHLDTVFPAGTDLTIKEKEGKLYAPGIGDDTRGLAELLSMVRALNATNIKTAGDIWFVGTVGEEGLGDLRGARALFRDHKDLDGFISIDGARPERITYIAVGSHRYRVIFKGPGGHSFSAFGRPSAIHAMGRAIAKIADLKTPKDPKTTFTVGTIRGGTSVNAIAGDAVMELDMRSVGMQALLDLEAAALKEIKDAVIEENGRWGSDKITVDIKLVGDRPAGFQPPDAPIIQAAMSAVRAVGLEPVLEEPASTDSNVAISLGIPAMTIGRGGVNGDNHSINEWFDPKDAYLGPQKNLLAVLALVGIEGVSKPILAKRTAEK